MFWSGYAWGLGLLFNVFFLFCFLFSRELLQEEELHHAFIGSAGCEGATKHDAGVAVRVFPST